MKPTIYFATDHAGFALKQILVSFVRDELGFTVEDCGAHQFNTDDDYPDFVGVAAEKVSRQPTLRAIILGGSGQGEAMAANRFPNVRATVFYGEPRLEAADADGVPQSILSASREHNDANVLSLGARFLTEAEAKAAVAAWLTTSFAGDARHVRRIKKLEQLRR